MKLRDLDYETRAVLIWAQIYTKRPSRRAFRRLTVAVRKWEVCHEREMYRDLMRMIFHDEENLPGDGPEARS